MKFRTITKNAPVQKLSRDQIVGMGEAPSPKGMSIRDISQFRKTEAQPPSVPLLDSIRGRTISEIAAECAGMPANMFELSRAEAKRQRQMAKK